MKGKLSIVTGATSGIGYQTARRLAYHEHHLVLVIRDIKKGDLIRRKILEEVTGSKIDIVVADLASQNQVRKAAHEIKQISPVVEVLLNNAGTWISERVLTEDGLEKVFAVNHLAYFLLTHLLYDLLAKSEEGRIINISSDSHFQGKMHFEDLSLKSNYHGLRSYAQSKLANVLFTYELEKRRIHDHITVNAVQPGLVKTDIGIKHTNWLHASAWKLRRYFGVTPEKGADTSVYLAMSPKVQGISGKYWADRMPKSSSKHSYNNEDARKLWEVSEKMCGISDYFGSS